jgi:hypothetical protein
VLLLIKAYQGEKQMSSSFAPKAPSMPKKKTGSGTAGFQ